MSGTTLTQLADALAEERHALLEHDAQRLLNASQVKHSALQALDASPPAGEDERLLELAEANRMNGVLVARRRRELELTLRHLGQQEETAGYDAQGQSRNRPPQRVLAVA